MAIALKNPQIRRNMIWFPYFAVTFPASSGPRKGNRIIGSSDVAIQTVIAPYYPITQRLYNIRNLQISNQTKKVKNY